MQGLDGLPTETEVDNDDSDGQQPDDLIFRLEGTSAMDHMEVVRAIMDDCQRPEEFFELYYWSREPEVLNLFRSLVQLPLQTRKALDLFLSQGGDCVSLSLVQQEASWNLSLQLRQRPAKAAKELAQTV